MPPRCSRRLLEEIRFTRCSYSGVAGFRSTSPPQTNYPSKTKGHQRACGDEFREQPFSMDRRDASIARQSFVERNFVERESGWPHNSSALIYSPCTECSPGFLVDGPPFDDPFMAKLNTGGPGESLCSCGIERVLNRRGGRPGRARISRDMSFLDTIPEEDCNVGSQAPASNGENPEICFIFNAEPKVSKPHRGFRILLPDSSNQGSSPEAVVENEVSSSLRVEKAQRMLDVPVQRGLELPALCITSVFSQHRGHRNHPRNTQIAYSGLSEVTSSREFPAISHGLHRHLQANPTSSLHPSFRGSYNPRNAPSRSLGTDLKSRPCGARSNLKGCLREKRDCRNALLQSVQTVQVASSPFGSEPQSLVSKQLVCTNDASASMGWSRKPPQSGEEGRDYGIVDSDCSYVHRMSEASSPSGIPRIPTRSFRTRDRDSPISRLPTDLDNVDDISSQIRRHKIQFGGYGRAATMPKSRFEPINRANTTSTSSSPSFSPSFSSSPAFPSTSECPQ